MKRIFLTIPVLCSTVMTFAAVMPRGDSRLSGSLGDGPCQVPYSLHFFVGLVPIESPLRGLSSSTATSGTARVCRRTRPV